MSPRNNALRFLQTALVLSGVIPLAVGCGDETSVRPDASREQAEVQMPKQLWPGAGFVIVGRGEHR